MDNNQKHDDSIEGGFYQSISQKDDSGADLIKAAKEFQNAMQEVKKLGRQDKMHGELATTGTFKAYVP